MGVSRCLTVRVHPEVIVVDVGIVDVAVNVDVIEDLRVALVRAETAHLARVFHSANGSTSNYCKSPILSSQNKVRTLL